MKKKIFSHDLQVCNAESQSESASLGRTSVPPAAAVQPPGTAGGAAAAPGATDRNASADSASPGTGGPPSGAPQHASVPSGEQQQ